MSNVSRVEAGFLPNRLETTPEAQMWAAVLSLAIQDAQPFITGTPPDTYDQRRYGRVAFNWILSEHCCSGSFHWVCSLLKIDPWQVRKMIGVDSLKIW